MDSLAVTDQCSPGPQQNDIITAGGVCLIVGGRQYNMPLSFLKRYPQTLLGWIAFEHQANPGKEFILDRNVSYFELVLLYLRDNGNVVLPNIFSKESFLAELEYFGVNNIDESKIIHDYHVLSTQPHVLMVSEMRSEIDSWDADRAIATLSKKCASIFMTTGGKLHFDIYLRFFVVETLQCNVCTYKIVRKILNNKS